MWEGGGKGRRVCEGESEGEEEAARSSLWWPRTHHECDRRDRDRLNSAHTEGRDIAPYRRLVTEWYARFARACGGDPSYHRNRLVVCKRRALSYLAHDDHPASSYCRRLTIKLRPLDPLLHLRGAISRLTALLAFLLLLLLLLRLTLRLIRRHLIRRPSTRLSRS